MTWGVGENWEKTNKVAVRGSPRAAWMWGWQCKNNVQQEMKFRPWEPKKFHF